MSYFDDYLTLKSLFNQKQARIALPKENLEIVNIRFESKSYKILPEEKDYKFDDRSSYFISKIESNRELFSPPVNEILHVLDSEIPENRKFTYSMFKDASVEKSKKIIILIHGLNEKSWDKYLPWAKILLKLTGRAIILFPIAFHMNRAPAEWSDYRLMNNVAKERKKIFPTIVKSTFANAAISTRLQLYPQRFFWSGLQSYYDVIQLITEIRSDNHPFIEKDASINLFGYSIGAFLTQLLMMANPDNIFDNSKLFIFCGGATMNRMSPVSRYIIDSEANIAIYSFYIENFEEELKRDRRLYCYFSDSNSEGICFRSMLNYHRMADFREKRFMELSGRLKALGLEKDTVIPGYEILNTLKGRARKIPISTRIIDFPYEYRHENPFPGSIRIKDEVNRGFERVFSYAAKFLR